MRAGISTGASTWRQSGRYHGSLKAQHGKNSRQEKAGHDRDQEEKDSVLEFFSLSDFELLSLKRLSGFPPTVSLNSMRLLTDENPLLTASD
jgi:hypothetical protein